ncbi:hypothetical protein [Butyrivibrio sp. INlla16]|uniref:hypothetical protein n=1 Tax=Butyrivibrio sp. INlla16 TaxID=1520807 RepID=UPI00088917D6|nr:hypothetical protein [Butyrivibrio sp. INlla16]SDB68840.1 hypothetical protein SAMN02910263_04296 [Butyrivibrio sp. INlla16]
MADETRQITLTFIMNRPSHKTAYEFLERMGHKKSYVISELFTYLTHMYGTGWDRRNVDRFLETIMDSSDGNAPVLGLSTPIPAKKTSYVTKPKKEIAVKQNTSSETPTDNMAPSAEDTAMAYDPKLAAIDFAENYILSNSPEEKRISLQAYWTELRRDCDYDTLYEEVILYYDGDYEGKDSLSFEEFIKQQLIIGGKQ